MFDLSPIIFNGMVYSRTKSLTRDGLLRYDNANWKNDNIILMFWSPIITIEKYNLTGWLGDKNPNTLYMFFVSEINSYNYVCNYNVQLCVLS